MESLSKQPPINEIEISYFRSVHKIRLKWCGNINVIVGGNDSGKSNILRALNLFFKNNTDHDNLYSFEKDLSFRRVKETQKAKTKAFLYVKITFNNIFNYSSLGDKFTVKKQWNRYSTTPDIIYPRGLNQATVTKFLNKIAFHYVPAIKSRNIFEFYLNLLHDVLIHKNIELSDASASFSTVVQTATTSMSEQIQKGLQLESKISFPEDMRILFSELDFATKYNENDWVSLKQRGDGIQTGHIPYILDFIAKQETNKRFIWVYEEPENSLEMNKAFDLAHKMATDFGRRNQIFMTTHSPAFYDMSGEHVSKWLIEQEIKDIDGETFSYSTAKKITSTDEVDDRLGIAAFIREKAKEAYEEVKKVKEEIQFLKESSLPIIFCEGKTDQQYISKYFELDPLADTQIEIREVGRDGAGSGCGNLEKLYKQLNSHPDIISNKCLFIFDCDVTNIENSLTNSKLRVFKLEQTFNKAVESGIENLFSVGLVERSEFWETHDKRQSGGAKIVSIKELNKKRLCEYICTEGEISMFENFSQIRLVANEFFNES